MRMASSDADSQVDIEADRVFLNVGVLAGQTVSQSMRMIRSKLRTELVGIIHQNFSFEYLAKTVSASAIS
jgi:hypothetical protein